MAKNYFNRYVWLLDTIMQHGHLTLTNLNDLWQRSAINEHNDQLHAWDLERELLQYNDCVEVLEPESLREAMKEHISNMKDIYDGKHTSTITPRYTTSGV